MDLRILQKFIMSLVVIAIFTPVMSLERRGRYINTVSGSSHFSQWTNSSRHKDSVSLYRRGTKDSMKKTTLVTLGDQINVKRNKDDTLWDDGILMSSAGNGKEHKSKEDDDDEKKTLSQQVKEGKYGLIQSELYQQEPKRPGIISYLPNSEVPKDTVKNLGGLDKDEIWMAENHILVLRGGNFLKEEAENRGLEMQWRPIDNYKAPRRQVKIPKDPRVPPPFPIQLVEGGSIKIIGRNRTGSQDNATADYDYLGGSKGYLPGEGPFFSVTSGDSLASSDLIKSANDSREMFLENKGRSNLLLSSLPPGAVFVPPPANISDYDEDDQSIFYPPPYSFVFQQDNTTAIPPGPLVPGIILPPPPDFFSSLDEKKPNSKSKTSRPTTSAPKARLSYFTSRNIGTKLYKSTTAITQSPIKMSTLSLIRKPFGKIKKNMTEKPHFLELSAPVEKTNTQSGNLKPTFENTIETNTEKYPWASIVSSKNVPLTDYYATTVPLTLNQPVESTPASIETIITTKYPGIIPNKASYYFYEETSEEPSTTNSPFYSITTVSPFLKKESLPPRQEKKYYKVGMLPSAQIAKDINVKLISSIIKDSQVFQYTEAEQPIKYERNNLKDNFSPEGTQIMTDPGPTFYKNVPDRSLNFKPYYTTTKSKSYYYEDTTEKPYNKPERKSKPIYQYSFEASSYAKRDKENPKELTDYNEFQDIQTVSDQYDYDGMEALPEQQIQTKMIPSDGSPLDRPPLQRIPSHRFSYKNQSFFQTTISPFSDSTMDPYQVYFTKQDEQLLDDVTKEYFTAFGKKLLCKEQTTTPIYGKSGTVAEKPKYNSYFLNHYDFQQLKASKVKVHYGDQSQGPFSLKDDALINYKQPLTSVNPENEPIPRHYKHPLQPINLDSEAIQKVSLKNDILINFKSPAPSINSGSELINVKLQQKFQNVIPMEDQVRDYKPQVIRSHQSYAPIKNYGSQRIQQIDGWNKYPRPASLQKDIEVNYRSPPPTINSDAEFITPVQNSQLLKANSYIEYSLPGGQVYFFTPQVNPLRQGGSENVYVKSRTPRILRRKRTP